MTLIEDLSFVVKEGESLMVSRNILSLHWESCIPYLLRTLI
jgi:hypothetical protein